MTCPEKWVDEVGCDESNPDGVHRCTVETEDHRMHLCGCGAMVWES